MISKLLEHALCEAKPGDSDLGPMPDMKDVRRFASMVQGALDVRYKDMNEKIPGYSRNVPGAGVKVHKRKKFYAVDIGGSGQFLIGHGGHVWGIKAYGRPHPGMHYGTLDELLKSGFTFGHAAKPVRVKPGMHESAPIEEGVVKWERSAAVDKPSPSKKYVIAMWLHDNDLSSQTFSLYDLKKAVSAAKALKGKGVDVSLGFVEARRQGYSLKDAGVSANDIPKDLREDEESLEERRRVKPSRGGYDSAIMTVLSQAIKEPGGWVALTDLARSLRGDFRKIQNAAEKLSKRGDVETKNDPREGMMLRISEDADLTEGVGDDLHSMFEAVSDAKLRAAIWKHVPPDSRSGKKRDKSREVMMTGPAAQEMRVKRYTTLNIDTMGSDELKRLAKAVGVLREDFVGGGDELSEASEIKVGDEFWRLQIGSEGTAWFAPLKVQENGGVKGLQVDPGKRTAKQRSVPRMDRPSPTPVPGKMGWKKDDPPANILGYFKKHPAFQKAVSEGIVGDELDDLLEGVTEETPWGTFVGGREGTLSA